MNTGCSAPSIQAPSFLLSRLMKKGEPRVITRAGGAPGISAFYMKFTDFEHTVMVLSNYDPPDGKKIADKIRDMVFESVKDNI